MRILICDSDYKNAKDLEEILTEEGHFVKHAISGSIVIDLISNEIFDLMIIDQHVNAFHLSMINEIREIQDIPFIFIGEGIKNDILQAYKYGALDYIRKPIIYEELIFKLRVLFKEKMGFYFKYKSFEIDDQKRSVLVDGIKQNLTEKEFSLLVFLIKNNGIAIKREDILNEVWGYGFFGDDRTIDTHIKKIRHALGQYRNLIKTIRGYGYKFEV